MKMKTTEMTEGNDDMKLKLAFDIQKELKNEEEGER